MTKVCVRCGEKLSASRKFCTTCGFEQSDGTEAGRSGSVAAAADGGASVTAQAAPVAATSTWHCGECGAEHGAHTQFCSDCGTPRERERRFAREGVAPAFEAPRLAQASDALDHAPAAPTELGSDPLGAETRPAAGPPCPTCGAAKLPGSSFCTSCGAALGNLVSPAGAPNALGATRAPAITCAACGAAFDSPRMFCTGCGARLGASAAPPVPPAAPPPGAFQPTTDNLAHTPAGPPQVVIRAQTPVAPPPTPAPAGAAPAGRGRVPAWVAVIATAMVFAGGGVAVALIVAGKHHSAPATAARAHVHTTVTAHATGTQTPPGITRVTPPPPVTLQPPPSGGTDRQAVLDAVNGHWEAIKNRDFAKAYGFLDPSVAGPESDWISSHESDGITDVTYNFSVASISGTSATVNVDQLQTMATSDVSSSDPSGCMKWSGTYGLTREGGSWLITSPNLSQNAC